MLTDLDSIGAALAIGATVAGLDSTALELMTGARVNAFE